MYFLSAFNTSVDNDKSACIALDWINRVKAKHLDAKEGSPSQSSLTSCPPLLVHVERPLASCCSSRGGLYYTDMFSEDSTVFPSTHHSLTYSLAHSFDSNSLPIHLVMLDLLPPELLQTVLEQVGPPYWDEYVGREHVEDLSAVALVSKRLCSFAQPLLFAVLKLQASSANKLLEQYATNPRCQELVSFVRFILCYDMEKPRSKEDLVEAQDIIRVIVAEAKHLTEVVNDTLRTHPMSLFSGSSAFLASLRSPFSTDYTIHTALKKLHLCTVSFDELEDLALPELVELSVGNIQRSSRGLEFRQVPSLRYLAWDGPDQPEDLDGGIVSTLKTFQNQFESLGFRISWISELKERIPDFSLSRTLVDVWIGSIDLVHTEMYSRYQHEIVHLRIDHDFVFFQEEEAGFNEKRDLATFINILKRVTHSSALRAIYIASKQPLPHSQPTEEAREARTDLIQACRDCKIEVVLEDHPGCQCDYSRISPDFVRRMKLRN